MTYKLHFKEEALKEWQKLDNSIKSLFKKKLEAILLSPKVEANKIQGVVNGYKIKLRQAGFRLVYTVEENKLIVTVIAVGKREKNKVYKAALERI